jgi:hypothetical protein
MASGLLTGKFSGDVPGHIDGGGLGGRSLPGARPLPESGSGRAAAPDRGPVRNQPGGTGGCVHPCLESPERSSGPGRPLRMEAPRSLSHSQLARPARHRNGGGQHGEGRALVREVQCDGRPPQRLGDAGGPRPDLVPVDPDARTTPWRPAPRHAPSGFRSCGRVSPRNTR